MKLLSALFAALFLLGAVPAEAGHHETDETTTDSDSGDGGEE